MYQMIRKQTRPNVNVPFFHMQESDQVTPEMREHFVDQFMTPEKHLLVTESTSPDELELTITTFWATKEDLDAFKADPICQQMQQLADSHFAANGITVETVLEGEYTV